LGLGNLLYLAGAADPQRYAQAREPLEHYTKLAPNDPRGWSLLGRTYYYIRMKDEAQAALLKADQLGDRNKEMYTVLGRLYGERRDYAKALEAFQKGDPGPKEYLLIAQMYVFQNQPERADSIYRTVLERDSTSADGRFAMMERAKMRFRTKDMEGALGLFQRRIALDPN